MNTLGLLSDAKYFDDTTKAQEIKALLDSRRWQDKMHAMKTLLAWMTLGRDMSMFFPDVVKNVVADRIEVKKLVYMFLQHYADSNQDLALLSINSFQKDLLSGNQRTRASALKAMTSIRLPIVVPIVILALQSSVKDQSSFVRRAAASAIPKVYLLDTSRQDECIELVAVLLESTEPNVLASTMYAFSIVCPNKWELLHQHFRKICHLLADFDEWGQAITVDILLRYGRTHFKKPDPACIIPEISSFGKDTNFSDPSVHSRTKPALVNNLLRTTSLKSFYSDDDSESVQSGSDGSVYSSESPTSIASSEGIRGNDNISMPPSLSANVPNNASFRSVLDPDLGLLLKQVSQLFYSTNAGVIVSVANLFDHLAPASQLFLLVRPLVRMARSRFPQRWCVLITIERMTALHPALFLGHLHEFFVFSSEPLFVRRVKLQILANLATKDNIKLILSEMLAYTQDSNKAFVTLSIAAIVRCAEQLPDITSQCIKCLLKLLTSSVPSVMSQSVIHIQRLLQLQSQHSSKVVKRLACMLDRVQEPSARSTLVWMLAEHRDSIQKQTPDCLRKLCLTFKDEMQPVRLQILNFAVLLFISNPSVALYFRYVMELCKYDIDYDIRDRCRMFRGLFFRRADEQFSETVYALNTQLKKSLAAPKLPIIPANDCVSQIMVMFQYGSMSQVLGHKLPGYYELPDFPQHQPDSSIRDNKQDSKVALPHTTGLSSVSTRSIEYEDGLHPYSEEHGDDVNKSDSGFSDLTDEHSQTSSYSSDDSAEHKVGMHSSSKNSRSDMHAGIKSEFDSSSFLAKPKESPKSTTEGSSSMLPSDFSRRNGISKGKDMLDLIPLDALSLQPDNKDISSSSLQPTRVHTRKSERFKSTTLQPDILDISAINSILVNTDSNTVGTDNYGEHAVVPSVISGDSSSAAAVYTLSNVRIGMRGVALNPVHAGGLRVNYVFSRQASIYAAQFNVVELQFRNESSESFFDIRMELAHQSAGIHVRGLDESIDRLSVGDEISIRLHIDFDGRPEPLHLKLRTRQSSHNMKVTPTIGELVRPMHIDNSQWETLQKPLKGLNEHSASCTNISLEDAEQIILQVVNTARITCRNDRLRRFASHKLADNKSVLLLQLMHIADDQSIQVTVNMQDLLQGDHLLKLVQEALTSRNGS